MARDALPDPMDDDLDLTQAGDGRSSSAPAARPRSRAGTRRNQNSWVISDEARSALEACELFRELGRQELMAVAALVEEYPVEINEPIILEGEPADHLYVIIEGRGAAQVEMERGWLSLGLVGPGDSAGWSSLVQGPTYPASIKALTPMRVAKINASGLSLLMNMEPQIGYPVHRGLSAIFYRQYDNALKALKTG